MPADVMAMRQHFGWVVVVFALVTAGQRVDFICHAREDFGVFYRADADAMFAPAALNDRETRGAERCDLRFDGGRIVS